MKAELASPRSVTRLLGLLDAMARAGEDLSLAQLAAALESPKSSLLLMMRPLVERGYLMHTGSAYRLGPAAFRLAADILSTRQFPRIIRLCMEELAEASGETVFLAVIDRDARSMTYVDAIDSPQAVRYTAPIGSTRPLYCSSAGRCLLAFQDDAWLERYIRTVKLKPITPRTITDREVLRREIEAIRDSGLAVSADEGVQGAAGIAAPVFDADGGLAAALLLAAPVDRFQRELPRLRELVKVMAERASGSAPGARRGARSAAGAGGRAQRTATQATAPGARRRRVIA